VIHESHLGSSGLNSLKAGRAATPAIWPTPAMQRPPSGILGAHRIPICCAHRAVDGQQIVECIYRTKDLPLVEAHPVSVRLAVLDPSTLRPSDPAVAIVRVFALASTGGAFNSHDVKL
jgi:hypothetical protein